jgi:hypothetical protein
MKQILKRLLDAIDKYDEKRPDKLHPEVLIKMEEVDADFREFCEAYRAAKAAIAEVKE